MRRDREGWAIGDRSSEALVPFIQPFGRNEWTRGCMEAVTLCYTVCLCSVQSRLQVAWTPFLGANVCLRQIEAPRVTEPAIHHGVLTCMRLGTAIRCRGSVRPMSPDMGVWMS